MIYIDRQNIVIPKVFESKKIEIAKKRIEEFYARSKKSRSQEKFVKPFEQEIKDEFFIPLRELFNGKCAYCESQIAPKEANTYDHFRPKNGARGLNQDFSDEHYWWLTYDWRNIYYACKTCNRYKSTWFPIEGIRAKVKSPYEKTIKEEVNLILDPCLDEPEDHLLFNEDGKVDFLSHKGKVTIDILKLNRSELINARLEVLKQLFGDWEEFRSKSRNADKNWDRIKEIGSAWSSILNTTSPMPFVAAQKQVLSKWINNHPDIQNFFARKLYELKLEPKIFVENINLPHLRVSEELPVRQKEKIENDLKSKSLKHVYLEKIELKNFKCFSYLQIEFNNQEAIVRNEKGGQSYGEPWLLFLGENGVGKSSLLKAIAIGLMGHRYFQQLGLEVLSERLLKQGTDDGFIKLYLKGESDPVQVSFKRGSNELAHSSNDPICYLLGYGSIRLLPKKSLKPEKNILKFIKAANLFDYSISLTDASNWLLSLSNRDFDLAAITLKDLILLDQHEKLDRDKKRGIFVSRGDSFGINIYDLSDGYQSVFALAVDIMSTLATEKVRYNLAEGIVLIDEIGTHLHPRWKMKVVDKLRRCFPRIQFIVTTHEPLCLRGLKSGETIVLTKNIEKEIVAVTDLPDPSDLRVDQILTSEFFGLKSTIDPATETLFEEYYSILALEEKDRSEDQKNKLLILNESIPKMKHLGDNLREELVYYVIDELLAKKSKTEGPKIREDLKKEAITRVENLWKIL